MIELSQGQITLIVLLAWVSGFFTAIAFVYPMGKRRGAEATLEAITQIRASNAAKKVEGKETPIERIAREAGAKVRGGHPTTN